MRRWYEGRLGGLRADDDGTRRARLAFLATEGAFFLRSFRLLPMDRQEWDDIFADIRGRPSEISVRDRRGARRNP